MLYRQDFRRRARRSVGQFLSLVIIAATSQLVVRADFFLNDANSLVAIDANSQAGLHAWNVDGQNQSFQQAFWGRIGNVGPEFGITSLGAPTVITPDARTLN